MIITPPRRTLATAAGVAATAALLTACSSGPDFTCGDFKGADTDGRIEYGQEVLDSADVGDEQIEAAGGEENLAIGAALTISATCAGASDAQEVGDLDESDVEVPDITSADIDADLRDRLLESQGLDPEDLATEAS